MALIFFQLRQLQRDQSEYLDANPIGFFYPMIIINKKDAKDTKISVDEGLSIIVSGGMISPDKISL